MDNIFFVGMPLICPQWNYWLIYFSLNILMKNSHPIWRAFYSISTDQVGVKVPVWFLAVIQYMTHISPGHSNGLLSQTADDHVLDGAMGVSGGHVWRRLWDLPWTWVLGSDRQHQYVAGVRPYTTTDQSHPLKDKVFPHLTRSRCFHCCRRRFFEK